MKTKKPGDQLGFSVRPKPGKSKDDRLNEAWRKVADLYPAKEDGSRYTLTEVKHHGDAALFLAYLEACGLPEPMREWEFTKARKWRADYAWPEFGIVLEVQGGNFRGRGRHATGPGAREDMHKFTAMALEGLRLIFRQPDNLIHPITIQIIRQALGIEAVDISELFLKPTKRKKK